MDPKFHPCQRRVLRMTHTERLQKILKWPAGIAFALIAVAALWHGESEAASQDLSQVPVRRADSPVGGEIVETYAYAADGSLTITVQNRSHGYQRRFVVPWRVDPR